MRNALSSFAEGENCEIEDVHQQVTVLLHARRKAKILGSRVPTWSERCELQYIFTDPANDDLLAIFVTAKDNVHETKVVEKFRKMCTTMVQHPNFVDCQEWTAFETRGYKFTVFKLLGKQPGWKLSVFWSDVRVNMTEPQEPVISKYLLGLLRGSMAYFEENSEYLLSVNSELLVVDTHNGTAMHASALFSTTPTTSIGLPICLWPITSGFCQHHGLHPSDLNGRNAMSG